MNLNTNLSLKDLTGQMIITGFDGICLNSELEELIVNSRIGGFILFERNFKDPDPISLNRKTHEINDRPSHI